MADISLITSLYRAAAFLGRYGEHLLHVAHEVQAAGLSLEAIIVLNEATDAERASIDRLIAQAEPISALVVHPLYVPRETLYASWNRGIQTAAGRAIGFWNVDDQRLAGALVEGFRLIAQGCDLIDFPYQIVIASRLLGLFPRRRCVTRPVNYRPDDPSPAHCTGPFALFSRDLIERAGPFDPHFRISGDVDWAFRPAVRASKVCHGSQQGGIFYHHGGNLSSTHNPREEVEQVIAMLRHQVWDNVHPVDPALLRELWTTWGDTGVDLPPGMAERLWGDGAYDRWQRWIIERKRRRRRTQLSETLRLVPRFIINRTGLRPLCARLGLVKSATVNR